MSEMKVEVSNQTNTSGNIDVSNQASTSENIDVSQKIEVIVEAIVKKEPVVIDLTWTCVFAYQNFVLLYVNNALVTTMQ